jgi:choline kinase
LKETETRAVILAAGVGSRLRPLTDAVPKCLVPVAGRPVLGRQIDALQRAGVDDVTVVAGYLAPQVIDFCRPFGDLVSVIVNTDYDSTNNMYSLQLALRGREAEAALICNGDVVFEPGIVESIVRGGDGSFIAVEPGRYIEESMKVSVDDGGRITALSKAIVPGEAFGVSIDLYRFSGEAITAICRTADRFIDAEGRTNLWTEVAIEAVLGEVAVYPLDIHGRHWVEIDNFDDLAEAERLFPVAAP